jgi:hypothetical protein
LLGIANHVCSYPHASHASAKEDEVAAKGKHSRAEHKGCGEHGAEEKEHGEAKGNIEKLRHNEFTF